MRNLSSTIKEALIQKGANLVGFADLKEIKEWLKIGANES
jgi:hypothetical protein